MPRKRQIDPAFFSDEIISSLSIEAAHLYIGLWCFADDAGNIEASPGQWRLWVFPGRGVTLEQVKGWQAELEATQRIVPYEVDGQYYYHIPTLLIHQIINHPSKPRCPPILLHEQASSLTVIAHEESVTTPIALCNVPLSRVESSLVESSLLPPIIPHEETTAHKLEEEKLPPPEMVDRYHKLLPSWSEKQVIENLQAAIERVGESEDAIRVEIEQRYWGNDRPTLPLLALFSEEEMRDITGRFPGVDLPWEATKCLEWWSEGNRKMKRPKVAFMNWLEKAGKGNGRKPRDAQDAGSGGHPTGAAPSKWDIEAQRMAEAEQRWGKS